MRGLSRDAARLAFLLGLALCCACVSSGRKGEAKPQGELTASGKSKPVLFGKLLGHDGTPMPMGHVTIAGKATKVASDGSFRIRVPRPDMFSVLFTGVDHGDHSAQLWMQAGEVEVQVRLGTYEAPASSQELSLVQIRFRDGGDISLGAVHPMTRDEDGKFRAAVPTPAGEFAYEIRGLAADSGRSMNGSARGAFRYDGDGNYCNLVDAPQGVLIVEHDPAKAKTSGLATTLAFGKPQSLTAQLAHIYQGDSQEESLEASLAVIRDETNSDLRHARAIVLFARPSLTQGKGTKALVALAQATLKNVPAQSPLWVASPTSIVTMASVAGVAYAGRVQELVRRFIQRDQTQLASEIALGMLMRAAQENDEVALQRYYSLIMRDLKKTPAAKVAKLFDPARKIRLGKTVPSFSLASADTSEQFTKESFHGKILLIDFWATWCSPCMQEMPNLHATYEEFHEEGFEILSINVDDKPGRGQAMRRRGKFPMPWANVVLDQRLGTEMKRRFEVFGLPSMILVDGKGTILGTDFAVRGRALGRQVRAALVKERAAASAAAR